MSEDAPLAGDARERLFSRVEAMRRSTRDIDAAALEKRLTDFSTLPGYAELRLQRAIGEKFGLENPYFRMHDGLASTHTEINGQTLLKWPRPRTQSTIMEFPARRAGTWRESGLCTKAPSSSVSACPPLIAASAAKALEIMHREPERVTRLQHNGAYFRDYARKKGLDTGNGCGTAVCPIVVGDSIPAVILSQKLFQRGINVQPVLYPVVPAKSSRLRFFLTAMHTEDEIKTAIDATVSELAKIPESMATLKIPSHQV